MTEDGTEGGSEMRTKVGGSVVDVTLVVGMVQHFCFLADHFGQ